MGGHNHRIPFLIEWDTGNIIDFDDDTIVLIYKGQILPESRGAIQPPDIAYDERSDEEEVEFVETRASTPRVR